MKKINDEIIKYLSGMLDENEKALFKNKLDSSAELQEQLASAEQYLNDLNTKDIPADEKYFVNLVPRVRQRIEKEKKYFVWKRLYYLAPALTVALIVMIFYPRTTVNVQNSYKDLAEIVANNISDDDVNSKYFTDITAESVYDELSNGVSYSIDLLTGDNHIPDSYISLMDYSNAETRQTLDNLGEKDLNEIYKKLNDINFK